MSEKNLFQIFQGNPSAIGKFGSLDSSPIDRRPAMSRFTLAFGFCVIALDFKADMF